MTTQLNAAIASVNVAVRREYPLEAVADHLGSRRPMTSRLSGCLNPRASLPNPSWGRTTDLSLTLAR
jgi:hypothetical protein